MGKWEPKHGVCLLCMRAVVSIPHLVESITSQDLLRLGSFSVISLISNGIGFFGTQFTPASCRRFYMCVHLLFGLFAVFVIPIQAA